MHRPMSPTPTPTPANSADTNLVARAWAWLGPLLLALLAGAAQALSLATPWPASGGSAAWYLQLLALATLALLLVRSHSWQQAALRGWVFGLGWMASTFWWLFISMHTYGGLGAALAILAVLALAAFLALFYALAAAGFKALARGQGALDALLFAALWLLAELVRGSWMTGLPWGAIGYAHIDGPLAALAPWLGVYGLSAVAACLAACLALPAARWWAGAGSWWTALRGAGAALAVLALLAVLPTSNWSQSTGNLEVALLQGNIPQDEKFQPGSGVPQALQWYGAQLLASRASLVVAPETAIPLLPQQLPPAYSESLQAHFGRGPQAALVGIPMGDARAGYTNSVQAWLPGAGAPYRYDKHHLVPFGEFVPPLFRWFIDLMQIPLGDFNRGALGQPSLVWQGQRIAPNICYEDLFGEELGVRFLDPAQAPTVFANLSNIGWFGDSVAIDQHLHISRMRALEFQRPMLRATNTGATAIIDHRGRVLQMLPRFTRGVLEGEVQGRSGNTPYAWWVARWGLTPLWLLGLGGVALAWLRARRWALR